MKKIALIMILLTILSKLLGFVREIILAKYYGITDISDVYFISTTIPAFLFAIVGTGILVSFLPLLTEVFIKKSFTEGIAFTNKVLNYLFIIISILVVILFIFTPHIVKLFAIGFNKETLNLAVNFTRITIFSLYFLGFTFVFQGFLQVRKKFFIISILGIPLNICIILSIIISFYTNNLLVLPLGILSGYFFQMLIMFPSLKKQKFKFQINLSFDENIEKMIKLSLPVLIGVSANELNSLIDRSLASTISIGGISALNYAGTVNSFIFTVFALTIANFYYSQFSIQAIEEDLKKFKNTLLESISLVMYFVIPISLFILLFSKEIISLLFGRGEFTFENVIMTAEILSFYVIGVFALCMREILSRVFFSLNDTITPMVNTAISMLVSILLNFILSHYLGLKGLALSTSLASIVAFILMFRSLRKIKIRIKPYELISLLYKTIIVSIITFLPLKILYKTYFKYNEITFILISSIGLFIYIFLSILFKNREVDFIVRFLKGKFSKGGKI
ncbi:murein biosynthesis integral membrane protein MurJ [Solibacillus sp. FSL W8-0372]|uniref:murein biosynthesis integral membrane protein MurJ n=1 Tax=Solibacillus sp. FSL W8-0372 TaxID=2921713 RepID=UPI0030D1EB80